MNKNIFITGGTSGIGKSLIYKFAKNNYDIFFTYFNNLSEAKSISRSLQKSNIKHDYIKMDLNKIKSIENAFKKFNKKFGRLNVFINAASSTTERRNFLKIKNEVILKNIKSLLIGNIISIKNALKLALRNKTQNKPTIINISSYAAISGGRDIHLYAASKSALNILTIALSKDYFRQKIKIISIVPRHIDTLTFRKNNNIKNNRDLAQFKKRKKIKKVKTPEEFANFVYEKIIRKSKIAEQPVVYYDSI